MTGLTLKPADWAVFSSYFLILSAVAWHFGRKGSGAVKEYFLAGNSLPWFVVAGSMVVCTISTEQIIGNNGASYQYGFAIAQWDVWVLPWLTMLIWVFLPVYLQHHVTTIPDFLARRYGEGLRDIFSTISVLSFTFLNMAVILYTGVVLLAGLFPIKLVVGGSDYTIYLWSAILVVSTLIYTMWGGLATVAWTDFMQFFVLFLAGGLIFIFAMRALGNGAGMHSVWGGWHVLRSGPAARFDLIQPLNHPVVPWPSLFMRVVTTQIYYNCATQFILQRALGARSDWDARLGSLVYGAFGLLLPMIDVLPGMIAHHLNPRLEPNSAVPFLIRAVVPLGWGVRGLILAGLTAAIMSALSSLINSTSTIFVLDIYKKWIVPAASERQLLRVGRLACIVFAACALIWTPVVGEYKLIFVYLQSFMAYIAAPAGAIFLLGVLWPKATHRAAVSAVVVGLPFCVAIEVVRRLHPRLVLPFTKIPASSISFLYISFAGWVVSMMVMVVVSLWQPLAETSTAHGVTWGRWALREPLTRQGESKGYRSLWLWYLLFAAGWIFYVTRFL